MSNDHDESHERLLEEVLERDRSREDPAVDRLLADCAACRQRLTEIESTTSAMNAFAAERKAVLSTPRRPEQAQMEERLRVTLEHLRSESPPRRRRARPLWPWLMVTAAALVAVFLIARGTRPDPRPIDQTLGNGLELVSPGEILAQDGVFESRFEGPKGVRFEFHVTDAAGLPILIRERGEPRWTPTTDERIQIPQSFVWWVSVLDASHSGSPVESERRSSSRLP